MAPAVFVFLTSIVACQTVWSAYTEKVGGELSPLDPDFCTGQNVTFTCRLLDKPKPNYTIGFTVKNQSTEYILVDEKEETRINETLSEYNIYNISSTFAHVYVRCYYWRVRGEGENLLGKISSAIIYPSPTDVKDFGCVLSNYENKLNCSWDFGKNYGTNMPKVLFKWRRPDAALAWNNCPDDDTVTKGYCAWLTIRDGYIKNANLTIHLTLEQKCGLNVSSEFQIDTTKIVKPHPVVDLVTSPLNCSCIEVTWSTRLSKPHYPKQHRIQIFTSNSLMEEDILTSMEYVNSHSRTYCRLQPYVEYTFNVSIRPTGYYSGFFSDEKESVAMTYSDIPSASPDIGGYTLKWNDCDTDKLRRVCIFWKGIPEETKNGPMNYINGQFIPGNTSKDIVVDKQWEENVTYGCTFISCFSTYVFQIQAVNVNGSSRNPSTIEIGAASQGNTRARVIVESLNGSYVSVRWFYPKIPTTNVTVVWCRNKNGDCDETGYIDWKVLLPDSNETVIQLDPLHSANDFLYGVGLRSEHSSSGLELEECVYSKYAELIRKPSNVIVSGQGDNTLVVTWDKLGCKSDEPYVYEYNIQYRNMKSGQTQSENVSSLVKARVILEGLQDGQSYEITVRGVTEDGRYGPESQPTIGVPSDKSLKPGAIVAITMSALVFTIFAGLGCFCVIRRCKSKATKVIRQASNITIPECADDTVLTLFRVRSRTESGYSSTPSIESSKESFKSSDSAIARSEEDQFLTESSKSKFSETMVTTGFDRFKDVFGHPDIEMSSITRTEEAVAMLSYGGENFTGFRDIPKSTPFMDSSTDEEVGAKITLDDHNHDIYVPHEDTVSMETCKQQRHSVISQSGILTSVDEAYQNDDSEELRISSNHQASRKTEQGFDEERLYIKEQSRGKFSQCEILRLLEQIPTPQSIVQFQFDSHQLTGTNSIDIDHDSGLHTPSKEKCIPENIPKGCPSESDYITAFNACDAADISPSVFETCTDAVNESITNDTNDKGKNIKLDIQTKADEMPSAYLSNQASDYVTTSGIVNASLHLFVSVPSPVSVLSCQLDMKKPHTSIETSRDLIKSANKLATCRQGDVMQTDQQRGDFYIPGQLNPYSDSKSNILTCRENTNFSGYVDDTVAKKQPVNETYPANPLGRKVNDICKYKTDDYVDHAVIENVSKHEITYNFTDSYIKDIILAHPVTFDAHNIVDSEPMFTSDVPAFDKCGNVDSVGETLPSDGYVFHSNVA